MNRIFSFLLAFVLIFTLGIFLVSCSDDSNDDSNIEGSWICESVHNSYPDSMTINSDGTGIVDGMRMNWSVNEDSGKLKIEMSIISREYDFSISEDTLYLDDYKYNRDN